MDLGDNCMLGGQKATFLTDPAEIELRKNMCSNQDIVIIISGRGKRLGIKSFYRIHRAEVFVSLRTKPIFRSTNLYDKGQTKHASYSLD